MTEATSRAVLILLDLRRALSGVPGIRPAEWTHASYVTRSSRYIGVAGGRCSLTGMTSWSRLDDLGCTGTLYGRPELLALDL
jgi:hypothetical protein